MQITGVVAVRGIEFTMCLYTCDYSGNMWLSHRFWCIQEVILTLCPSGLRAPIFTSVIFLLAVLIVQVSLESSEYIVPEELGSQFLALLVCAIANQTQQSFGIVLTVSNGTATGQCPKLYVNIPPSLLSS